MTDCELILNFAGVFQLLLHKTWPQRHISMLTVVDVQI